jgi:hypothetical protein
MKKITHIDFTTGSTVWGNFPKPAHPIHPVHPSHGAHGHIHNKFHRGFIAGVDGGHIRSTFGKNHKPAHATFGHAPNVHSPHKPTSYHRPHDFAAVHFKKFINDQEKAQQDRHRKNVQNLFNANQQDIIRKAQQDSFDRFHKKNKAPQNFGRRTPIGQPKTDIASELVTKIKVSDVNVWNIAINGGNPEIKALLSKLKSQSAPQRYLTLKLNSKTFTFYVQFLDIDGISDNSTEMVNYTPDSNGNVSVGFKISINIAGAAAATSAAAERAKGMHLYHEMYHLVLETMEVAAKNGANNFASPIYQAYNAEMARSLLVKTERQQLSTALGIMLRLKDQSITNTVLNNRVNDLLTVLVKERYVATATQTAFNVPVTNKDIADKYANSFIKYRLRTFYAPSATSMNRNLAGLIGKFFNAY